MDTVTIVNQRSIYAVTSVCLPAGFDKGCKMMIQIVFDAYICNQIEAVIDITLHNLEQNTVQHKLKPNTRMIPRFTYIYKTFPSFTKVNEETFQIKKIILSLSAEHINKNI